MVDAKCISLPVQLWSQIDSVQYQVERTSLFSSLLFRICESWDLILTKLTHLLLLLSTLLVKSSREALLRPILPNHAITES